MKLSLDRTFRIVWLVVGGLILLALLIGGVLALLQLFGNAGAGDDAARIANEARTAPRKVPAVRYDLPQPIRGTSTRIVLVEDGGSSGYSGYGRGRESFVNAVFVDAAGARLLLDRPAWIREVRFPRPGDAPADPAWTWISYVMALEDTDRNGILGPLDPMGLYVTDLDGRGLRPVLLPPLRYQRHQPLDGGRMLVYALEPPAGEDRADEERMRQRAYVYDVAAARLSPYTALDSATARAAEIVAR